MHSSRRGFLSSAAGLLTVGLLTPRALAECGAQGAAATRSGAGGGDGRSHGVAARPTATKAQSGSRMILPQGVEAWSMTYPFALPALPYAYGALEPHIDARTMELHHTKHHQTYVDKLNAALEPHADLHGTPLAELLLTADGLPATVRTAVRNHGGGHANHALFWEVMAPGGGGQPDGAIGDAIGDTFGGFDGFRTKFETAAKDVFGSGWAWLVTAGSALSITATPNQDSPLMEGARPLLGLDVWEHAYYLKYQNKRPDYIGAWWNVVNWDKVGSMFGS